MIDKSQPIIVKKINKVHAGHHGGAWKVAFADFAVAMMAFFLLMWLLGSISAEQKAAIAEYFDNPSMSVGASPAPAPSTLFGEGGSNVSMIDLNAVPIVQKNEKKEDQKTDDRPEGAEGRKDEKRLEDLMGNLQKSIELSKALKEFKDQLLLDTTPEGLRIQIIDKENRPMFESGSPQMKFYTVEILMELAKIINKVPNKISVSGHTDATRFAADKDYTNWELSADRANTARRALLFGDMNERKIARVVGMSSSALFDKQDPASAKNRRIAIVVLNKKTEAAIAEGEGVSEHLMENRNDLFGGPEFDLPLEVLEDVGKAEVSVSGDEKNTKPDPVKIAPEVRLISEPAEAVPEDDNEDIEFEILVPNTETGAVRGKKSLIPESDDNSATEQELLHEDEGAAEPELTLIESDTPVLEKFIPKAAISAAPATLVVDDGLEPLGEDEDFLDVITE